MNREEIKLVVNETIRQLKKEGLLKSAADVAYHEISARLRQYYRDGETDPDVTEALRKIEEDEYFKIIPLFYRYNYTVELIGKTIGAEARTVYRNKKRLSLRVYELLELEE